MSTPSGTSVSSTSRADIGVIGGSGFYEFLDDAERVRVTTPFGDPSDDVVVGDVEGRRVAFVARHGRDHRFPPHRVNYRANLWALRAVGVRQVLAPCAVGSLRAELTGPAPSSFPTRSSTARGAATHTVYDAPGPVVHAGVRRPLLPARAGPPSWAPPRPPAHRRSDGGTLVVINGPRFSSAGRVALAPAARAGPSSA